MDNKEAESSALVKEPAKLTKKDNITQMVKFLLFSISAAVIQAVSFTLLFEIAALPYWPCYLVALVLSVLWNFTLNREFTFKSATNVPIAMLKVTGYYLVFAPLSTWWGNALTGIGCNEYLILFGTMVINLVSEFLFYRFFVYGNSINTNKRADNQRGS